MSDIICPVCKIHDDVDLVNDYEIARSNLWLLRHHPSPSPMVGWLMLDSVRHLGGPLDLDDREASEWGKVVRASSRLVKDLTNCDRVYAIAFGEGARHLHLHLIPRFEGDPSTSAWSVADLYRDSESGLAQVASSPQIFDLVRRAREVFAWDYL